RSVRAGSAPPRCTRHRLATRVLCTHPARHPGLASGASYARRMTTTTLLHSGLLTDERGERSDGWVLFDGDTISAVGTTRERPDAETVVDLGGARLTPGFVDIHGHGGGGFSFDDGPEALTAALAVHRALGTTRSVISLV